MGHPGSPPAAALSWPASGSGPRPYAAPQTLLRTHSLPKKASVPRAWMPLMGWAASPLPAPHRASVRCGYESVGGWARPWGQGLGLRPPASGPHPPACFRPACPSQPVPPPTPRRRCSQPLQQVLASRKLLEDRGGQGHPIPTPNPRWLPIPEQGQCPSSPRGALGSRAAL